MYSARGAERAKRKRNIVVKVRATGIAREIEGLLRANMGVTIKIVNVRCLGGGPVVILA